MDLDTSGVPDSAGPSYYNQFAHWPLLMLAQGTIPGALEEERPRFRAAAIRNIDYLLAITDEEFSTPHYSLGRDWGRHVGEWSNYYLMKSLALMREHDLGTAELREQLERAVRGAVGRIYESFLMAHGPDAPPAPRFPGNHAAWHGLLLAEAGTRFKEPRGVELGRHFFRTRVLPFQLPSGCWPEGGGIVVNYSMVTAQALSRYAELAGDRDARDAALQTEQAAAWNPLLAWAETRHGIEFTLTQGVLPVDQPEATVAALHDAVFAHDHWRITALTPVVTIGGSLVAGLALVEEAFDAEMLWEAVSLDEMYQERRWGADSEAQKARAANKRDWDNAVRFLGLL